ncbi:hypothetical protein BHE97_10265 [Aeromicrobium sp. PE09-221]|uniref:hypothetical protein n=1 Tax=Aeromicrobium sp. PE09-221 TaxID=1898043 RepID=UPI000B3EC3D5|nr:hypothetical protein [Aeromicrobium sp. PE09-221]OUZ09435.1 hypothetical protein BHE97_10265 [Aeromicrobium sp. PE09-221]
MNAHRPRVALIIALAVPLVVALAAVGAGATGGTDSVRAAVVNEDEIVSVTADDGTEQPVAVGRLLAAELTDDDAFDWTITNRTEAESGLEDGTYGAVLIIDSDTSAAAVSPAGVPADVRHAHLRIQTSDAVSPLAGELAQTVTDAALAALNAQVTETFVDNILVSLGTLRGSLAEAAQGATTLTAGQRDLADGAAELAAGIGRLESGAGELADGTSQLADGATQAATGSAQLAGGLDELDDGAQELRARTAELPAQTAQLDAGAQELKAGAEQLDAGVREIADSVAPLFDIAQHLTDLIVGWSNECVGAGLPAEVCATVDSIVAEAEQVNAEIQAARGRVGELTAGTGQLAAGLQQLSDATARLAAEAPQLTAGIGQLADGTASARTGADELAGGAGQLAGGVRAAADGAADLREGAGQARSGSGELADGSEQLAAGGRELADGLDEGVRQLPIYSDDEREQLSKVAARPVTAESATSHRIAPSSLPVPSAVVIAALAAAALAWSFRAPLGRGDLLAGSPLRQIVGSRLLPTVALTVVAMAAALVALALSNGLGAASTVRFTAVAVLGTLALTALGQGLTAAVGRLGAAAIALLAAVVTLSVRVPEAASDGVRLLYTVSPLTPLLEGLWAEQTGTASLGAPLALIAWGLVGLGLSAWAAQRCRSDVASWFLRPA